MSLISSILLALALGPLPVTPLPEAGSQLELIVAPLADLHLAVRAAAQDGTEAPAVPGIERAVAAAKACDAAFKNPVAWALVDALFLQGTDVAAVRAIAGRLPETRRLGELEVPIRAPTLAYLEALAPVESAFMEQVWPARKEQLEKRRAQVEELLAAADPDPLEHLRSALGFPEPGLRIPIHLTIASPAPGGVTLRSHSGPLCSISLEKRDPATLCEVILHEATHAIDASCPDAEETIPARLRAALAKRGLDPRKETSRNAWHTLFFLQAAETVRACIDAEHVDVGISSGYYERVGRVAAIERQVWKERGADGLSAEEVIERIADGVCSLEIPPEND
ncbi:MAG: hypothetical protein V2A76_18010 [Planctomycetota bacterium]